MRHSRAEKARNITESTSGLDMHPKKSAKIPGMYTYLVIIALWQVKQTMMI